MNEMMLVIFILIKNFFQSKIKKAMLIFIIILIIIYSTYTKEYSISHILYSNQYNPKSVFSYVLKHGSQLLSLTEYDNVSIQRGEEDFDKSIVRFISYLQAKNIKFDLYYIVIQKCPSYAFRMNDTKEDNVILSQLDTNTSKTYNAEWRKEKHIKTMNIIKNNKNAKFFNIYTNNSCDNIKIFKENVKKYPNQIIDKYVDELPNINRGTYWILIEKSILNNKIHFFTQTATQFENINTNVNTSYLAYTIIDNINDFSNENISNLIADLNIKLPFINQTN